MINPTQIVLGAIAGLLLGFLSWFFLPLVIYMQRRRPQWYLPQLYMLKLWQPKLYQRLGFDGANEAKQLESLTVRLYRFLPLIYALIGAGIGTIIGTIGR